MSPTFMSPSFHNADAGDGGEVRMLNKHIASDGMSRYGRCRIGAIIINLPGL